MSESVTPVVPFKEVSLENAVTEVVAAQRTIRKIKSEVGLRLKKRKVRVDEQNQFFRETTFHALAYFGSSTTWPGKIFWGAILVVGVFCLWYSTKVLLENYLFSPSQVSVRVVTPKEGLKLPEITVCSMRRINRTRADQIGLNTTYTVDYLYSAFASLVGFGLHGAEVEYFQKYVNKTDVKKQFDEAFVTWTKLNDKLQIEFGGNDFRHDLGHMLKYLSQKCVPGGIQFRCVLAGEELDDCCAKIEHFRNYNGPCFRMSYLREFKQEVGGIREGLTVLHTPPPEEIYVTSEFNVHTSRGLQMFFHPFSAGIELDPMFLAEGWDYSISLSVRHMRLLVGGQSKCTDKVYYDGVGYAVVDPYPFCMYTCLSYLMLDTCGCKPINNLFFINDTRSFCTPEEMVECVIRKREFIKYKNPANCTKSCPYACHENQFQTSVSTLEVMETPAHAKNLPTMNNKSIRFSVYYSQIQYTEFREIETVSVFAFISNIGGIFGLWTGASCVSILHVIQYIITLLLQGRRDERERHERLVGVNRAQTRLAN